MKTIHKKIRVIGALVVILFVSMGLWLGRTVYLQGSQWANTAYNPRITSAKRSVTPGDITDRSGVTLVSTDQDKNRTYISNTTTRRALSHTTGDTSNMSGAGVQTMQASVLYDISGSFFDRLLQIYTGAGKRGNDIQLTVDAVLTDSIARKFPEGYEGAVVVMNYRTGEILSMVSKGEYEWISLLNEIEERKNSAKSSAANDDFMLIERYLDNIGEPSSDSLPYDISSAAIADYEWDDADECETSDSDEQDALIDSFIEAEKKGELFVPKVQNVEENSPQEKDSLSLKKIREKAFLSESLAKLYVKQHKYEQALAIFSSLNLKYSKKFTYFAHQIRYLETILSYEKGEESK